MLVIKNLNFSYGSKKILRDISFNIKKGEIVSLIGVSGSGKTTLFRLITGAIASEESVLIENKTLPEGSSLVTYMRQEDLLLPWRTVISNLELLEELGISPSKGSLRETACLLLEKVGLKNCAHLYPNQLSGGMRQRVSLARAILQNRPLLLLDEPFGSLDVIIREQLYALLKEIKEDFNKTIMLVTHDFRDALALSDRILVLSEGTIKDQYKIDPSSRKNLHYLEHLSQSIRQTLAT